MRRGDLQHQTKKTKTEQQPCAAAKHVAEAKRSKRQGPQIRHASPAIKARTSQAEARIRRPAPEAACIHANASGHQTPRTRSLFPSCFIPPRTPGLCLARFSE